jgi:hypothetical protein
MKGNQFAGNLVDVVQEPEKPPNGGKLLEFALNFSGLDKARPF